MKKRLTAAANKEENSVIKVWIPSIVAQLYWSAATSDGDGDLALAKWKSMANHVGNIHHHADPLYPQCLHEELDDRKWMRIGTTDCTKQVYAYKIEN